LSIYGDTREGKARPSQEKKEKGTNKTIELENPEMEKPRK